MKNIVHNLRDGSRFRRALVLVPAVLLPISAMGITTPSYLRYRDAVSNETAAKEGFAYASSKQAEWKGLGSIESRLASLEEMNQMLESLVPDWQEELVVHGAVRDAAQMVGMTLTRIQLSAPERIGEAVLGKVVVEREVSLSAEGTRDGAQRLIDRLRTQGWPTCLHAIDANADHSSRNTYGFELRLGVFHYAPAEDFIEEESEEDLDGIPTLEEPI